MDDVETYTSQQGGRASKGGGNEELYSRRKRQGQQSFENCQVAFAERQEGSVQQISYQLAQETRRAQSLPVTGNGPSNSTTKIGHTYDVYSGI